jgi:TRAP-type mannitol/chloroaromatic compound transport system permease small subunit
MSELKGRFEVKLVSVIETISIWSGKTVSFLLLALIGVITYEVVARYFFHAPTIWAHETMVFTAGIIYIIGGAYTHCLRGHVVVDIVYNRFSPRGRAVMDIFIGFVFFLMYVGIMLWMGGVVAWESIMEREHTGSFWNPPVYPIKAMIPLGALLMLLQGLAKFIRDVKILITGRE